MTMTEDGARQMARGLFEYWRGREWQGPLPVLLGRIVRLSAPRRSWTGYAYQMILVTFAEDGTVSGHAFHHDPSIGCSITETMLAVEPWSIDTIGDVVHPHDYHLAHRDLATRIEMDIAEQLAAGGAQ